MKKFRVWNYKSNDWASNNNIYINGGGSCIYQLGGKIEEFVPVAELEIEYATSYKDTSGKQIYENDIVSMSYEWNSNNPDDELGEDMGHYLGVISIVSSLGVVMRNSKKYSEYEGTTQLKGYKHVRAIRTTIIGNIHQNPELLTNN